jgi:hypothetical protein
MYSKTPTILALSQLSLGKLECMQLSNDEYDRLIRYNVKYISFLEELYTQYRKSLVSIQLAQFKFSTEICILIDEMFHIFLKWFEKLIFWNRVNSIKASPCTYYKELLSENISFIFELFRESLIKIDKRLVDIIKFDKLKQKFKEMINIETPPQNNGDYFQHTEQIKDTLIFFLESSVFWLLSIDRTKKEDIPILYIASSMLIMDKEFTKQVFLNIIKLKKDVNKVILKPVTKNVTVKSDLVFQVKSLLEPEDVEIVTL